LREQLGHALDHLVPTSEAVDLVDDVQAVDVHVNNRTEAVSGFPKPEALILSRICSGLEPECFTEKSQ
jgi:hypothetical protein